MFEWIYFESHIVLEEHSFELSSVEYTIRLLQGETALFLLLLSTCHVNDIYSLRCIKQNKQPRHAVKVKIDVHVKSNFSSLKSNVLESRTN